MDTNKVYIYDTKNYDYHLTPPFHPSKKYPEYRFSEISNENNLVYDSFRNLLRLMELDRNNWNSRKWNPFKGIIAPNDCVFIKPNLVLDNDKYQNCLTTHPSMIRVVIDFAVNALKGNGEIIVGDAPLQDCNFRKLTKNSGLEEILKFYIEKGINIKLLDLRTEKLLRKKTIEKGKIALKGDINGYKLINLKSESNLHQISINNGYKKFRVTNYDPYIMENAHNLTEHKYLISNSVLKSDVIIEIPKIKTHRKAGITCCLKNSIGINGKKDFLPHHKKGSLSNGGDEYLKSNILKGLLGQIIEIKNKLIIRNKRLYKIYSYPLFIIRILLNYLLNLQGDNRFFEGSWHGNDTLWRTITDLNQILFYGGKNGTFLSDFQRKVIYFCDGTISGEGEGPLEPTPKKTGILIGGFDPLLTDLAIAELFNIDYKRIPQIYNLFHLEKRKISTYMPEDLRIISNNYYWNKKKIGELKHTFTLNLPKGWKNNIKKR